MKLMKGNMWEYPVDVIFVTTNADVKANGMCVMGKGAAREAAALFPTLASEVGYIIQGMTGRMTQRVYGLAITATEWAAPWAGIPDAVLRVNEGKMHRRRSSFRHALVRVGAFQVKYHWHEAASLDLIELSAERLRDVMQEDDVLGGKLVSLNFPGIGNGRLKREDVLKVLERVGLSDDLIVWEKG